MAGAVLSLTTWPRESGAPPISRPSSPKWIAKISLDTTDETLSVVAAGTFIEILEVVASETSGLSQAAVPFDLEERGTSNVYASGCAGAGSGGPIHPGVQANGCLARAGTIAASGTAVIHIKFRFLTGNAITPV